MRRLALDGAAHELLVVREGLDDAQREIDAEDADEVVLTQPARDVAERGLARAGARFGREAVEDDGDRAEPRHFGPPRRRR